MRVHRDWLLTPQRAAIHLPSATAVIADLHLGYDRVRRRSGEAVPATSLPDTLTLLSALFAVHPVRRLIVAGDLLEGPGARAAADELQHWLRRTAIEWLALIPGNHDRGLKAGDGDLPIRPQGVIVGDWKVVHGDRDLPCGRVVHGHDHPCLRWQGRLAVRCFLVGPRQLVLPAFSSDAAGVNILGQGRWRSYRCAAIASGEVLDLGEVARVQAAPSPYPFPPRGRG
jgi:putative SbcD/Mre11-related phosphoesterase